MQKQLFCRLVITIISIIIVIDVDWPLETSKNKSRMGTRIRRKRTIKNYHAIARIESGSINM